MPVAEPTPFISDRSAEEAEQETVHDVYESIAPHFSQTRRKPWPLVTAFLDSLPPHTIGLDSGAGNGSHLPLAIYPPSSTSLESRDNNAGPSRMSIALDRSQNLLSIAKGQVPGCGECLRAELGFEGWRKGVFDWAISIAAIHHLSTPERRIQAVRALIRPLVLKRKPPYSRFMIYVWAYEQGPSSKRKMGATAEAAFLGSSKSTESSESGTSTSPSDAKVQDVLVPWAYQPPQADKSLPPLEKTVYNRYYHLFVKGELRDLVEHAAKGEGFSLREGEAESSLDDAKWMRISGEGYEMDNWWLEGEVGEGQ